MVNAGDSSAIPQMTAAAIELLARKGYDATSVDELAEQTGMSRSTFFRRFKSKEDVVFADHDLLLAKVETVLEAHGGDPFDAVTQGARLVLAYHLGRPEATRFRWDLLRASPTLRDRELVASHRYERAFSSFLRANLPEAANDCDWVLVSFAAATVAVHNLALRSWLRGSSSDPVADLETELAALSAAYRGMVTQAGSSAPATDASRVVVATVGPGQTTAQVVAQIARSLA